MSRIRLRYGLLALALLCSALTAKAQGGNDCVWWSYCYSWGYYSPSTNTVFGSSTTMNENNGMGYLAAQAAVLDYSNYTWAEGEYTMGWVSVTATVSLENVWPNWYFIDGWHWTYNGLQQLYDGESWSDPITVVPMWEGTESVDQIDDQVETGGRFHLLLYPWTQSWYGWSLSESLGTFVDGCYANYAGAYNAGQPSPTALSLNWVGRYDDKLAVGVPWGFYYVSRGGGCSWHGNQTVSYSSPTGLLYGDFAWNWMELWVDATPGYGVQRGSGYAYWTAF